MDDILSRHLLTCALYPRGLVLYSRGFLHALMRSLFAVSLCLKVVCCYGSSFLGPVSWGAGLELHVLVWAQGTLGQPSYPTAGVLHMFDPQCWCVAAGSCVGCWSVLKLFLCGHINWSSHVLLSRVRDGSTQPCDFMAGRSAHTGFAAA
jgi:hypothetical protein